MAALSVRAYEGALLTIPIPDSPPDFGGYVPLPRARSGSPRPGAAYLPPLKLTNQRIQGSIEDLIDVPRGHGVTQERLHVTEFGPRQPSTHPQVFLPLGAGNLRRRNLGVSNLRRRNLDRPRSLNLRRRNLDRPRSLNLRRRNLDRPRSLNLRRRNLVKVDRRRSKSLRQPFLDLQLPLARGAL